MAQVQVEREIKNQLNRAQPLQSKGRKRASNKSLPNDKETTAKKPKQKLNQIPESISSYIEPSTVSTSLNDISASTYEIVSTLLFFTTFFDFSLTPILESHFSRQTNSLDYLTRVRIALLKMKIMSNLTRELLSNPLSTSSESLYFSFVRICELQGVSFDV